MYGVHETRVRDLHYVVYQKPQAARRVAVKNCRRTGRGVLEASHAMETVMISARRALKARVRFTRPMMLPRGCSRNVLRTVPCEPHSAVEYYGAVSAKAVPDVGQGLARFRPEPGW